MKCSHWVIIIIMVKMVNPRIMHKRFIGMTGVLRKAMLHRSAILDFVMKGEKVCKKTWLLLFSGILNRQKTAMIKDNATLETVMNLE